jgi:tetratricopeptide (TPR) repeat protein
MPARPESKSHRLPYWFSFTALTLLLCSLTVAFVLVVLRQRFVLHAGLRESGVSFPAAPTPFGARQRELISPTLAIGSVDGSPDVSPGPSESFWSGVMPLLRAERYQEALPLFTDYLERFPNDHSVHREYATTLSRAGRLEAAERALSWVAGATRDPAVYRQLARMQRDRRAFDRAVETYGKLLADRPEDSELRHELAQTLAWAERYESAIAEYRRLIELAPDRSDYLIELARVLFWADQVPEAEAILARFPEDSPDIGAAQRLALEIALVRGASTAEPEAEGGSTVLERARAASAEGDLARAELLYADAVADAPEDPVLLREWADFLQYRQSDFGRARALLLRLAELNPPDGPMRLRLAQLAAWTGHEEEAHERLVALVEEQPESAEAWLLLGEVNRWRGNRQAAARAYDRVLVLDPEDERATVGRTAVREASMMIIDAREDPGAGPVVTLFSDTDDYQRLDVGASVAVQPNANGFRVLAGYRRLEGFDLEAARTDLGVDEGGFAEVEWIESLGDIGAEPTFGAQVELPDLSGTDFRADFRHGPAYPITQTYGSASAGLVSDRLLLSAYRPLSESWTLWMAADGASVRGAGTDNWRLNGQIMASRRISEVFSAGVFTSALGYTDAAPADGIRRLYWDPRLFWATGVVLDVRTTGDRGFGARARVQPGIAIVDERSLDTGGLVPQLGLEGGLDYRFGRSSIYLTARYARGREGGYNSFGLDLGASIRP